MEIELGRGKMARRAYGFDEVALVPGRVTINPDEIDVSFALNGSTFDIPFLAAAMDGVVDVGFAQEMGRLGGVAVLNLDGVQTRYEDPSEVLNDIAQASPQDINVLIQKIYTAPVQDGLIGQRIEEIKAAGVPCARLDDARGRRTPRPDRPGGGRRRPGRAGHGPHCPARQQELQAPQLQGPDRVDRDAGDRRQLRGLRHRARAHGHRGQGAARRGRSRRRLHQPCRARRRCAAGHRHGGLRRGARRPPAPQRRAGGDHHRRWHASRGRRRQGVRERRRRGDDRLDVRLRRGSGRARQPLGHGHPGRQPPARHAHPHRHQGQARRDPLRPGARRRRQHEPGRRAEDVDGHVRRAQHPGLPAHRDGDRAVDQDRGQGATADQRVGMGV